MWNGKNMAVIFSLKDFANYLQITEGVSIKRETLFLLRAAL
jgi:hypothetical protein